MKIAFLAPRFHSNQIKLIEYLIQNKDTVSFFVNRIGNSEDHRVLIPIQIELNHFYKAIRKHIHSNNVLFDYTYGFPSIKQIRSYIKNNFELIVIRDPYSILTLTFAIISRLRGTKIIFYTQREVYRKPNYIKDIIAKILIYIFNAKWISPCLGNIKSGKNINKLYYIPFCIEPICYKKTWFIDNTINILSIGKFVPRKNHHLLINALRPLAEKYKFKLYIIGEVSNITGNTYYNEILELAKDVNFDLIIKTNLLRDDVFEAYKNSDIFVLPSKNESASVSNLEAMAFGLPIITSDSNNTSNYTIDNGLIFKTDSVSDLSSKLEVLLSDKNLIMTLGNKSLETVKLNHNSAEIYKFLYDKVFN